MRSFGARRPARARCDRACANRRIYSRAHPRCVRNNATYANHRARNAPAYRLGAKGLSTLNRIRRAATARRATCLLRRYHAATAAKSLARRRSHSLS